MWLSSAILCRKLCINRHNLSFVSGPKSYFLTKDCNDDCLKGNT